MPTRGESHCGFPWAIILVAAVYVTILLGASGMLPDWLFAPVDQMDALIEEWIRR